MTGKYLMIATFVFLAANLSDPADVYGQFPKPKISNPLKDIADRAADLDRQRLDAQRQLAAKTKAVQDEIRRVQSEFDSLKRRATEMQRLYDRARAVAKNGVKGADLNDIIRNGGVIRTNRDQVRASVRGNAALSLTVFSKEFDHAEEVKLVASLAASVSSGNPGPTTAYLKNFLAESKTEVLRNLRNASAEAREKLLREFEMRVIQALKQVLNGGGPSRVEFGTLHVQIGVATYNHSVHLKWNEPSLDRVDSGIPGIPGLRLRQTSVERTVPLPNTFQPYLKVFTR